MGVDADRDSDGIFSDDLPEKPVGIGIEFSEPYIDEAGKKAAYPSEGKHYAHD